MGRGAWDDPNSATSLFRPNPLVRPSGPPSYVPSLSLPGAPGRLSGGAGCDEIRGGQRPSRGTGYDAKAKIEAGWDSAEALALALDHMYDR